MKMGEVDGSGLAEDGGGSDVVGNGAVVGLKVDVVVMKGVCEGEKVVGVGATDLDVTFAVIGKLVGKADVTGGCGVVTTEVAQAAGIVTSHTAAVNKTFFLQQNGLFPI